MSKPKQQFFSAGLTALSAQLTVNQNKRKNQNNYEKVKFDPNIRSIGLFCDVTAMLKECFQTQ